MKHVSPLGRPVEEFTQARVGREPIFGGYLLAEALDALLTNELPVAKSMIRDVIKGSLGYAELSRRTAIPEKSLIRMFGPAGNPTAANLARVIGELQRYAGVRLEVHVEAVKRRRPAKAQRRGKVA
jgi:DNA-binding phage protein